MTGRFNSYIDASVMEFWKEFCFEHGELKHYERGDFFFQEGKVAPYIGFIKSGTLKYIAFDDDGIEHVMGLEFTDEFVADFPFSLYGLKARLSVVATSPCEILCVSTKMIGELLSGNIMLTKIVAQSTEAVFGTVYDRYKALYTQSPQQRYNDLISKHPNLFSLFSLRDIASFLKITPTHLSRLRRKI